MALSCNYGTKVITVDATATLRAVYSDLQELFDDAAQMDDQIPLRADTPTLYTLINGWTFSSGSIAYLTSAALQDDAGDNIWTNVQSLGDIQSGTTLYIEQPTGTVVWTSGSTGHINMLLKVRDAGTDIDSKNFTIYARLFSKTYASFSTTGGAIISNCPLATAVDPQLTMTAPEVAALTGLSITWGSITRDAGDGHGAETYGILVDGNGYTLVEIYNWIQTQLLSASDIDAGAGTHIGKLTSSLITFTGTGITAQGVWIDDIAAADANKIKYTDSAGVLHTPPVSVPIAVGSSAGASASGARVAVYTLAAAYDAATYTPASITGTLIDPATTTLNASGEASTSITYTTDLYCLVRIRKAGLKPAELGVTLTSVGLSATLVNEIDSVYAV